MHSLIPVPPVLSTKQELYHLRNSTTIIKFTLNRRVFPPVQLKNIQWTFTAFPNVSRTLNTSCLECNPRYNFTDDLLSLTISNLQVSDNGSFRLQVSNEAGVDSAVHNLTVFGENLCKWCVCVVLSVV